MYVATRSETSDWEKKVMAVLRLARNIMSKPSSMNTSHTGATSCANCLHVPDATAWAYEVAKPR
eukprot:130729-Prymnesium_polylepis.3